MRTGLAALLLTTVLACSGGAAEDSSASGADLTQAEASTALTDLLAHPETTLAGVGDQVDVVVGASDTWRFFPYQPKTTAQSSINVADDTSSVFVVVGSSGALFLLDLSTGACAGATPKGVNLSQAASRLHADIEARATASTKSVHVQGLGDLVENVVGDRVADLFSAAATKLADTGIYTKTIELGKSAASKVADLWSGSAKKAAVDTAPAVAGAANDNVASSVKAAATAVTEPGPTTVGKAADDVVNSNGGKVEVGEAKSAPADPVALKTPSHAELLATKTTGFVGTTADQAATFLKGKTDSVFVTDENLAAVLKSKASGTAMFVSSLTQASQKALTDKGFSLVMLLQSAEVDQIAAGTATFTIPNGAALIETRSAAMLDAFKGLSKTLIVDADAVTKVLALPDQAFATSEVVAEMKTGLDSINANGKGLFHFLFVGDLPEGKVDNLLARLQAAMKATGLQPGIAQLKSQMSGFTPASTSSATSPFAKVDGGAGDTTTAPSGDDGSSSDAPAAAPDTSSDTPLAHKASAGGCSSAPGNTGGDVGALALGLAVVLVARRRRRS